MTDIVLYNTRTRKKQAFEAIVPGEVGIYTCGPTVYGPAHIGNMRALLVADLLKRFLQSEGFEVVHVINITDVGHLVSEADEGEDKMEVAARNAGETAEEIANRFTQIWREDRAALNCLEPEHNPKATEHIREQIELGQALESGDYLYRIEDGMYFDTSRFSRYRDLARLDLEGQRRTGRIGEVAGKRQPADFAVWKFAKPGENRLQEWDSPWGRGFPGWHLECSAMSSRYLGNHFDIHTGGIDLATVHHTNEVAQSECAFGLHPWVEFWLHNEFLDFAGEKMSKSEGNVKTLSDLRARGYDPLAFRYFFLQAHYRQQQTFNDEAMEAANVGHRRLVGLAGQLRSLEGKGNAKKQNAYRDRFRSALADDLNAPRALAVLWDVARSDTLAEEDRRDLILDFDSVLGLNLAHAELPAEEDETDPRIDSLLEAREQARAARDFETADRIRDELAEEGIEIIDTPDGVRWRRS